MKKIDKRIKVGEISINSSKTRQIAQDAVTMTGQASNGSIPTPASCLLPAAMPAAMPATVLKNWLN